MGNFSREPTQQLTILQTEMTHLQDEFKLIKRSK